LFRDRAPGEWPRIAEERAPGPHRRRDRVSSDQHPPHGPGRADPPRNFIDRVKQWATYVFDSDFLDVSTLEEQSPEVEFGRSAAQHQTFLASSNAQPRVDQLWLQPDADSVRAVERVRRRRAPDGGALEH